MLLNKASRQWLLVQSLVSWHENVVSSLNSWVFFQFWGWFLPTVRAQKHLALFQIIEIKKLFIFMIFWFCRLRWGRQLLWRFVGPPAVSAEQTAGQTFHPADVNCPTWPSQTDWSLHFPGFLLRTYLFKAFENCGPVRWV